MHPNTASSAPKPAKVPVRHPPAKASVAKPGTASRRIRFGTASVTARKPAPSDLDRNLESSTEALRRTGETLLRPGIRLPARKNVPLFEADPERPGHFLRKLNGRTERGILQNGRFTVTG